MPSRPESPRPAVVVLVAPARAGTGLAAAVREAGYRAVEVKEAAAALAAVAGGQAGVLLVDLAAGQEAMRALRAAGGRSAPPVVLALADPRRPEVSAQALRLGVLDVLPARVGASELEAALAAAVQFRDVARAPRADASTAAAEASERQPVLSLGLRRLLDSVQHLADTRANVLIVGERGSGREVLARALHARGPHAAQPLAVVDCASLEAASDAPLAGGGAGGFGARVAHILARPVFLRDLHALPPPAQSALERALEAREPASGQGKAVPPAVLASAEPAIADAVARRRFSPTLFARLAVVRLDVPPLRQRPQDIPLLAAELLREVCAQHGLAPKALSPAARTLLAALPWRGNADELRFLLQRLALMIPRKTILLEDVLAQVNFDGAEARGRTMGSLRAAREQFERDYILAALVEHRGRLGEVARALGVERTNLYRKMKHLGIRWREP